MDTSTGGSGQREAGRDTARGTSFAAMLVLVLRERRLLVGLPLGALVAAVALSFVMGKRFTAESSFMPDQRDASASSAVAGLASQFGVDLGSAGAPGESIDFYATLVQSNELLREVVETRYDVSVKGGRDTLRGTLVSIYGIKGDTPLQRVKSAVDRLRNKDIVAVQRVSAGLVVVRAIAPWPDLAEAINRRILELVNEFNMERRQSTAVAERKFLESRTQDARAQLQAAEANLAGFVERNRRYSESPQAALEYNRLQRKVDFSQATYTSLAQNLEKARLDAVRNTPVITVVDPPEGTARKTAPKLMVNALLGILLGFFFAVAVLIGREMLASVRRTHPGEYSELETAARETLADLRLGGLVQRLRSRGNGVGRREEAALDPPDHHDG